MRRGGNRSGPGGVLAGMRLAPALVALVLVLAACGSAEPPGGEVDAEGSWRLIASETAQGEVPLVDGHPITLTIAGSEFDGTAACNHYGGRLAARGGGVAFADIAMTAMGCEAPVAASEAAYMAALAAVTAIGRDGEELVLGGPNTSLRFEALPPPPTAELLDTTWVLETVVAGAVASSPVGEPATLELRSDGTLSGSTGCRGFGGAWVERRDEILAHALTMTDNACPPDVSEQDAHVVSVIGDGFVPTLEGDVLTVTDPDGSGLVYRARE